MAIFMQRRAFVLFLFIGLALHLALPCSAQQIPRMAKLRVTFEEVPAKVSGLNWVHNNAHSPDRHLPEAVGAGCAFFDYDNDGWMDIYLVNSGASDFHHPVTPLKNALYRNNHNGTFTDVTDKACVAGGGFGMGVAAADYDGDGWQDIYLTTYGRNILYRNNGNGTFTDVTQKAGVAAQGWFTSSVWFDYDNDSRLDLFVASFVSYDKSQNVLCMDSKTGRPFYCAPKVFKPTSSRLFQNHGDGKFSDVSKESGIGDSLGKAFGVVATDANNDGLNDLFVANDTVANFLFVNQGGGKFEEVGLGAGVAYNETGNARSGMGVDATDFDGDGWQDLFVSNVDHEFFSLYRNQKDLTFTDEPGDIASATQLLSGWGLKFFDYDNDGDADLFLVNGHPDDLVEMRVSRVKYREPLLMFENIGRTFKNVSTQSGPVFAKAFSGRGMAAGDFDNDGDLDVLISNNGEAPLLLQNQNGNRNSWLGLQLVATKSNAAAVGASITWQAGGSKRSRLKTAGGSYLSSHDPREVLGCGSASKLDSLEIRWPSGKIDRLTNLPLNTYIKIVEGSGLVKGGATATRLGVPKPVSMK